MPRLASPAAPRALVALAALVFAALLAPPPARAQPRPADPRRGLVASYPFDGEAVDEVTATRAAAHAVLPEEDRDGRRAGALLFDGARSHVSLGDGFAAGRFTIAAWIRPDAVDRPMAVVSKVRNLPGHWQKNFELRVNAGGRVYLHVMSGAAWEGVEGTRPLVPGRWTHVLATYDGARAQLFVDGVRDGAPLAVAYAQTRAETFVGARPEGGGRDGRTPTGPTFHFLGAIDELAIWDRPLADAEIAAAARRAGPARPAPRLPPEPSIEAELLARYPLDGDARDEAGGADGELRGAPKAAEDRHGDAKGSLAFTGREHLDLGTQVEPETMSVAAWVRPSRLDRALVVFAKASGQPGQRDRFLELRVEPRGRVAFVVPGAARPQGVRSARPIAVGRWTHLVATFDGERAVIYVDGVVAGEAVLEPYEPSRGVVFASARPDATGKRARAGTAFEGRLDDLRLFRGVLDGDAVDALFREPPPPRGGGEEPVLLARVDALLARYDAACGRRSLRELARAEATIVAALAEAERDARAERDGARRAQSLRRVASEFQALERRADPISLDRKRSALFGLSELLWTELAEELDARPPEPRRGDDRF